MEGAAASELPFKWKDRLAGNVHAQTTDVLSGAAEPEKPLFVHCQACDPEKTGMASLQLAKVVVQCSVCKNAACAHAGEPEPAAAPAAEPAPEAPESIPGVYKSSDNAERLAEKIKNRRADAANFAAFLAGADLAAAVASCESEVAQLEARIVALGAAQQAVPEAVPPPAGFVLPPVPSATFRTLVDGSLKGICHSADCGGAQTDAEIQFHCANCGNQGSDCVWLPQMRSPLPEEMCCILMMEIDEPPVPDGPCPPVAVVFDPCGCVADVTMFAEQIKNGIESGGGRQVITMDPCTKLFSMRCPMHPQGGDHETSFVHCVHHFKVGGPKLYDRIKDWGMEQMVFEMGGICCPIGGCQAQGTPFMPPERPIDADNPTKQRCEACSECDVRGGQCPGCDNCKYFCSECNVEWGSSADCAHSWVPDPDAEPAGPTDREMLLAAMQEFGFAQCPKCKEGAELKQGCKFVYCRCKQRFCYHCSRPLTEDQHYSHFEVEAIKDQGGIEPGEKDGPFGDKCVGGRKDRKGNVAEPACPNCKGWSGQKTDCDACRDWKEQAEAD